MDFKTHNTRMVNRFLWLETLDPDYAKATLEEYRRHPDSPNPNILADVRTEKACRLTLAASESSSEATDQPARPTTQVRK